MSDAPSPDVPGTDHLGAGRPDTGRPSTGLTDAGPTGAAPSGGGSPGTDPSGTPPAAIPARRGVCLVVAAPSGAGKSTITRALLAREPRLSPSVSVTTRAPRGGEQEGVHYFFRNRAEFDRMAAAGELLEWAEVFGRGYGTPRAPVERALADGRDVVFDVDWQGFRQLRAAMPGDVCGVFVLPPSLSDLRARLRGRGTDDADEVARRMAAARGEIEHWHEFDHVVVNAVLEDAVRDVRAVLHAARLRRAGLPTSFVEALLRE